MRCTLFNILLLPCIRVISHLDTCLQTLIYMVILQVFESDCSICYDYEFYIGQIVMGSIILLRRGILVPQYLRNTLAIIMILKLKIFRPIFVIERPQINITRPGLPVTAADQHIGHQWILPMIIVGGGCTLIIIIKVRA